MRDLYVLWQTNRKSYMIYLSNSAIFNDPERLQCEGLQKGAI